MGAADEDEELFNTDIELDSKTYSWADKYKPRKPRFYNRVHTVSGAKWGQVGPSGAELIIVIF